MELLERIGMKDCQPMATAMTENAMNELERSSPATDERKYHELMCALLNIST